jgi:hypothetical protein
MVAWVDVRKPADKVIVEVSDLRESFWSWVSFLNPRYHYCFGFTVALGSLGAVIFPSLVSAFIPILLRQK